MQDTFDSLAQEWDFPGEVTWGCKNHAKYCSAKEDWFMCNYSQMYFMQLIITLYLPSWIKPGFPTV